MCDGGFGSVVRDVKILLHPVFRVDNLDEAIREVLQRAARRMRYGFPRRDIEATVPFNSARIRQQCQQQEDWYRDVYSPAGMEQLRDVFQVMLDHTGYAERQTLHFEQLDYWYGDVPELRECCLSGLLPSFPHPMSSKFIQRILKEFRPDQVEVRCIDFPRIEGLLDSASLPGSAAEESGLEYVGLFRFFGVRFPAPTAGADGAIIDCRAARQLGDFLSCGEYLQILIIDLDAPDPWTFQDKVWLNGILAHAILPLLTRLHVSYAQFDLEHLVTFLDNHQTCLLNLELENVRLRTPANLLELVRHMLPLSCFRKAEVTLKTDMQELSGIINELRTLIEDREHDGHNTIAHCENEDEGRGVIGWLRCGPPRWRPTAAQDQQ